MTRPPDIGYRNHVEAREPGAAQADRLVERRVLADAPAVGRMLRRLASEIVEKTGGAAGLALVGIRTGGLHLAERLARQIEEIEGRRPLFGTVDITLYRDDVFRGLPRPEIGPTELPFELGGVTVVLVDDVLYTGRTIRAALDALMDFGRPHAVQLAVLIDRGRRELPIQADYVGLAAETAADESVKVFLTEAGHDRDRVVVRVREVASGPGAGEAP
ncbi:MAG TPA: bifunctional pyr operon transcriptional regulator/uracil phosphoribosyltransferase PyrR [Kofleriaceae bacterium]|nr:bifunctional pyr operon transcriptional regulator/uracil phosphoribosyltransferase PyrR [Kofleriaceae bacterium]